MELVALRKMNSRNGNFGYAEGALASFAEEVYMLIIVVLMAIVAVAQLVAHAVAPVLKDVYQVVLTEECECAEDARLVDGKDFVLQL